MDRLAEDRVEQLLAAAASVRCLVVGDLMLDRYVTGSVERISPEAPVPVVRVESESSAVGGAANVAHNVIALGAECAVVGLAGKDAGGVLLERELEELGIDTGGLVTTDDRPTTVKTRVMARRHQVARFDHEQDDDVTPALADALVRAIRKGAEQADVLVIEDYNKGTLVPAVVAAVLDAARQRSLPVVVDPKRRRFFGFGGATLFKPNARELADALGEPIRPEDSAWMEDVRARVGADHLLLTLGERGMALRSADGEYVRVPAVARSVYDVSGAGDTVTAVLALMLGAGASVVEAAILANHAAALEVAKAGVATVSPDEILEHYRAFQALGGR
jgi:rfaE bifunctional protein kinase chain/domain